MSDPRLARQARTIARMAEVGLDLIIVTNLANIRWLTGFSGSAGVLVFGPDRRVLCTDFRYGEQAPQEVGPSAETVIERSNVWGRVEKIVRQSGVARIGFESHTLTWHAANRIQGWFAGAVGSGELIEELRQSKDEQEVAAIREAGKLALDALAAVVPTIRVGERELDVAARLEAELRVRGSEWHPFETIVASGPRSALPHARTSERVLKAGDILLIDFGARVRGYCSDVTRTFVLGRADDRQRAIHELVQEAQLRARDGIRTGMTGAEADVLAREVIAERGFGEAFGHSLGHGLGLEVHEGPRLATTATAPLPVGAVVTVEPGIYLPGWGGVRLEDDLWLSADGPVLLTDGRTELIELDA
jgi:Xaa-Pro aminopeptidase